MIIKQVILELEQKKVVSFLHKNDLSYDQDITETLYIEDNDEIVATISRSRDIIKCLAVEESYRGQNIASKLVSEIINSLRLDGVFHYKVYTKTIYEEIFIHLGFSLIVKSDKVCILEFGSPDITETLENMKQKIENQISHKLLDCSIGAIVVNCNPITLGHYKLIEFAAKKHDYLIVFVVEEDESVFTFKERYSLVYLALNEIRNIVVIPSSNYVVSQLTFPSYFLKTVNEAQKEHAKLDALIFKKYFIPAFNIQKRYIGTETSDFMIMYNEILMDILGEYMFLQPRFEMDNEVISASRVRKLIFENKIEEALKYVPDQTRQLLKEIAEYKYEQYKG